MRVIGQFGEAFDRHIIQAKVQNGVHHARHRGARARADGNEPRVLGIAELLARDLFGFGERGVDLILDVLGDHLAVRIVAGAGLGGDGEALRNGQADAGHFGEVRALAAQQLAHVGVALFEQVDVLCHVICFSFRDWIGFVKRRTSESFAVIRLIILYRPKNGKSGKAEFCELTGKRAKQMKNRRGRSPRRHWLRFCQLTQVIRSRRSRQATRSVSKSLAVAEKIYVPPVPLTYTCTRYRSVYSPVFAGSI